MIPIKRGRGRPRKTPPIEQNEVNSEFMHQDDYLPETEMTGMSAADAEIAATNDELENADIVSVLGSPEVTGSVVKIMKVDSITLRPAYLTTIPAKNFSIENVKQTYGGGEYIMFIQRSNGTTVKSLKFAIDARFKGKSETLPAPEGIASPQEKGLTQIGMQLATMLGNKIDEIKTVNKNENDSLLPLLIQQTQESSKMQMQILTEFAKAMRPTSTEPASWLGVCAPIVIELIRNFNKQGSSLPELIGALVQLRDLTPGGDGGTVETKEKSVWDKIIESVAPALAPALVPALMQHVQKNVSPISALPAKPVLPSAPPSIRTKINPSQNSSPTVNKEAPMRNNNHVAPPKPQSNVMTIEKVMPYLLKGAENDTNPESYYDLTKTFLSGEEFVQLVAVLENENWKQIVFGQFLDVIEPYSEWFNELRECFINPDTDNEEDDEDNENESPNDSAPIKKESDAPKL